MHSWSLRHSSWLAHVQHPDITQHREGMSCYLLDACEFDKKKHSFRDLCLTNPNTVLEKNGLCRNIIIFL